MRRAMPVSVFIIHFQCDECNEGEMMPTGEVIEAIAPNPPSVVHQCTNCAAKMLFTGMQYPRIEYAPLNLPQDEAEGLPAIEVGRK